MVSKEKFNDPLLSRRNGVLENGADLAPICPYKAPTLHEKKKKNGNHFFGEIFIFLSTNQSKVVGTKRSLIHRGCPKCLGLVP